MTGHGATGRLCLRGRAGHPLDDRVLQRSRGSGALRRAGATPRSVASASSSFWRSPLVATTPRKLLLRSGYGGGAPGGRGRILPAPPLTPLHTAGPATSGHASPQRAEGDEEGRRGTSGRSLGLQARVRATLAFGGGAYGNPPGTEGTLAPGVLSVTGVGLWVPRGGRGGWEEMSPRGRGPGPSPPRSPAEQGPVTQGPLARVQGDVWCRRAG